MTASTPRSRIGDICGEFVPAGLQGECAGRTWRNPDLVRFAVEEHRENVGGDFNGVGINDLAV
jgi:hypothetical protein